MLWNEHYQDEHHSFTQSWPHFYAELRELAVAGCPRIQVEEPPHHGRTTRPDCTDAELEFFTERNRQLVGVDARLGPHLLGQSQSAARLLGAAQ